MSVQQLAPNPLIPATVSFGIAAGKTTKKILVNPLSGVHHCADCEFAAESYQAVHRHRHVHGKTAGPGRPRGSKKANTPARLIGQAVQSLVDAHGLLVDAKPETDNKVDAEWKTRALAAEKSLRSLRRILGNDNA